MNDLMLSFSFAEIFGREDRAKNVFKYYKGNVRELFERGPRGYLTDKEKTLLSSFNTSFMEDTIDEAVKNNYQPFVAEIRSKDGNLDNFPIPLFIKGITELLHSESIITVIGTKSHSKYAVLATDKLIREICSTDCTVLSQLTEGLNSYIIETVIKAGGKPIVLMPYGTKKLSSKYLTALSEKVVEAGGLLIAPLYRSNQQTASIFKTAGTVCVDLSDSVLITQAPKGSGTIKIGEIAMKSGKTAFFVAGTILNDEYSGSNYMINNGGKLAESGLHIVESLGIKVNINKLSIAKKEEAIFDEQEVIIKENGLNEAVHRKILDAIDKKALTIDELCEYIDEDTGILMTAVTMLEAYEVIKCDKIGAYSPVKSYRG